MAIKRKRMKRQDTIRALIREHHIRTQQDLCEKLLALGYRCTQATISRDIANLNIVRSEEGYYVLSEEHRLQRMISHLVEEVHVTGNIAIVKTSPGGAAGVSAALDKANLPGLLGTVAGDNTIMVVTDSPEAAIEIKHTIDHMR